ncbi:bidirectional sugar transporter SWEET16-like isoform X2 [Malania oleifera]|uniref:bidirectional sugar transporter SWEET16-like isoform X2 n=1 Tax=Malania oleifera TaxID=397392 RepID=UPI0025AE0949|nr:bidirectional sugar transporter SWEET16-like isoform X2 [Malania oleifera]
MAAFSFIVGIIGQPLKSFFSARPLKTFWGVVKKKSTEDYKALPYITTLLSTSLWTFYGLLKPGGLLVVTVNSTGTVFQFIYVTLFLIYAPNNKKVKLMKLVGLLDVGFLGLVIAITLLAFHGDMRLTFSGVICSALNIGMYAAPLAVMRTVMKTESVEFMPFALSFFLFLNASSWSIYAVLVKDYYIGVPSGIGLVLGSFQLLIYAIYKNKSESPISTEKMVEVLEEEGSAHLVRGAVEMQAFDNDDAAKTKTQNLRKGWSLPKPTVLRQQSLQKIMKTFSLNQYELHHGWPNEN